MFLDLHGAFLCLGRAQTPTALTAPLGHSNLPHKAQAEVWGATQRVNVSVNIFRRIRLWMSAAKTLDDWFGIYKLTPLGHVRGNVVADGAATPGPYMDAPGLPSFQFMMVVRNRLHPYIRTLVAAFRRCP